VRALNATPRSVVRPRLSLKAAALGALCAWPSVAPAGEVDVRTSAVVTASPTLAAVPGQAAVSVPFYALVGLDARHLQLRGFDDLAVSLGAWGSAAPGEVSLGGDVTTGYVDALTFNRRLRLKLGRQLVTGGVARLMSVDGLSATVRAPLGLGLSGYFGMPVQPRFATFFRGDLAYGGRVFWAPSLTTEVGASVVRITDKGAVVREDVGLDAQWMPLRSLSLNGAMMWSIADMRLAELDLGPRWQPLPQLEVRAGYVRTAPDLFLARNSIFTVFADTTRDEAGGSVNWAPGRALSLTADGHALWLSGQTGYDVGLIGQLKPFRSPAVSLTAQVRRLAIPSNGYSRGRVGGRYTLPFGLALSADFDAYLLDTPVRGQNASFVFSGTATYAAGERWLIGLGVLTGVTPLYEKKTQVMAKFTWLLPEST
jgi:hypothetical protein